LIPDLPDGFTGRPIDPASDFQAVSELLRACDRHDIGSEDHLDAWITEVWGGPHYRGGIAIEDAAGTLVGAGEIEAVDPAVFVDLFVSVLPAHRPTVRRRVVAWGEDRGVELAAGPTALLVTGSAEDPSFGDELTDLGYRHVRTFWHMHRRLPATDQPSEPPDHIRVRPSIAGDDDRVVFEVMNEAFIGHFGYVPVSQEVWWQEHRGSDLYDPSMFFVAETAGQVAGAAACYLIDEVGWIAEIAVLEPFRGRGIGKALLRRGFHELAARGATRARLNVDSENEAGATRLYESVGMRLRRAFHVFEKRVGGG
jgi:mycothiol synthase